MCTKHFKSFPCRVRSCGKRAAWDEPTYKSCNTSGFICPSWMIYDQVWVYDRSGCYDEHRGSEAEPPLSIDELKREELEGTQRKVAEEKKKEARRKKEKERKREKERRDLETSHRKRMRGEEEPRAHKRRDGHRS